MGLIIFMRRHIMEHTMENVCAHNGLSKRNNHRGVGIMGFLKRRRHRGITHNNKSNLANASINEEYTIKAVETSNHEMQDFLFTLGCYEGEKITVISILADQYVIVVKDARYSIDRNLAECITI